MGVQARFKKRAGDGWMYIIGEEADGDGGGGDDDDNGCYFQFGTDIGIGIGIGIDADCGADGYDSDVFASRAQTSSAWSQLSQEVFTGWERMAIEKRLKEATAHGSVDHEHCGLSRP
ncbi:hypothetical protein H634G_00808 [Metarhizium anisopliae BRIP 53293]|uniref:Uncharacterized protein n=1 Tax=Metarhizium anisopliae BRIP 53293 TaxID=1291518 RepID=A0A0D9PDW3_METAN|nr:hypothetical protein H634G_00808 [Metarhizium anisopliae BRIP 53293]KJK93560.1 hypothetical protein H633G_02601 [Metarhizium anisopliae BRIP 53284]